MQGRSIPTRLLLTETLRLIPQFLVVVALVALAYAIVYFAFGSSELLAVVFASFYASIFFAAPLASSSVRARRGLRLFTGAGGKTLLFCFVWGCVIAAGFTATLQLWQGMEATALNYAVAMGSAGVTCAVTAAIPHGR